MRYQSDRHLLFLILVVGGCGRGGEALVPAKRAAAENKAVSRPQAVVATNNSTEPAASGAAASGAAASGLASGGAVGSGVVASSVPASELAVSGVAASDVAGSDVAANSGVSGSNKAGSEVAVGGSEPGNASFPVASSSGVLTPALAATAAKTFGMQLSAGAAVDTAAADVVQQTQQEANSSLAEANQARNSKTIVAPAASNADGGAPVVAAANAAASSSPVNHEGNVQTGHEDAVVLPHSRLVSNSSSSLSEARSLGEESSDLKTAINASVHPADDRSPAVPVAPQQVISSNSSAKEGEVDPRLSPLLSSLEAINNSSFMTDERSAISADHSGASMAINISLPADRVVPAGQAISSSLPADRPLLSAGPIGNSNLAVGIQPAAAAANNSSNSMRKETVASSGGSAVNNSSNNSTIESVISAMERPESDGAAAAVSGERTAGKLSTKSAAGRTAGTNSLWTGITCLMAGFIVSRHAFHTPLPV